MPICDGGNASTLAAAGAVAPGLGAGAARGLAGDFCGVCRLPFGRRVGLLRDGVDRGARQDRHGEKRHHRAQSIS